MAETFDDSVVLTVEARLAAEALIVDVDGFEGPLDLLLMLLGPRRPRRRWPAAKRRRRLTLPHWRPNFPP
jgi:hypothetical protein